MNGSLDSPAESGRAPITVLHVDDDRSMVELTADLLRRHHDGLTVRTATDPREALGMGIEDIDCLVSDYEMPGMDGVEFLETVREDHPSLPFILFTGKGSEEVASEAISAGVTDYLQKGTGTEQYELLCQRIENAVGRRRARTNYRELFEKTPVGLTIHDPDTGVITDVNRGLADMLGYEPEELVGTHPGDLSPDGSPFTRENATRLIQQAVENGTQTFEWQDQTSDGDLCWVSVTLRPTAIDGRQRVLAVVQDVDEMKERERRLRREKQRFEAIFEHSNDAIFVLDPPNDDIVEANSQAADLLGYSTEELRESVRISEVHPEHIEELRSFLDRVRQQGAGWTDEFCCLTKSGTEREVEISAAAVEQDDDQYLVANVRDISERVEHARELEQVRERMEFVLETTDAVIWERDPRTGAITTHPEPCPVLDGPIATAAEFRKRIHPEDVPAVREAMTAATRTGEGRRVEFRTTADVTADWIETRIQPVTDEDGSVTLLAGIARDITDRKRNEQALQRQNDRLDEFVSVVSHDLRNPLNTLALSLDLIETDSEDQLRRCRQSVDRMERLIDDLLTLARHGEDRFEAEPVDLDAVARDCWGTVVSPDVDLRVETDLTVLAEEGRLKQLFENLFANAVAHGTPSTGSGEHGEAVDTGEGALSITVGPLDGGFYVEDDGVGIPEAERERCFEIGYSNGTDGTGFGLNIVERVVEAHGWEIRVTESDEGGARFEITGVELDTE